MKNTIFTLIVFLLLSTVTSCDKMNDNHQKYLDEGPRVYLGKPDNVVIKPGFNEIRLIWTNNADTKIKKTRIFYNYGSDSITIPINRTKAGFQKDSITLKLEPGNYTFDFYNLNEDETLRSLAEGGKNGKVYGINDQLLLETRPVKEVIAGHNYLILKWGDVTSEYDSTIVRHINNKTSNVVRTIYDNNTFETLIENVEDGDELHISSAYKPEKNYMDYLESIPVVTKYKLGEEELAASRYSRCTKIPFDNTTDHAGWSPFSTLFDKKPGDAWLSNINDANSQNNNQFPISFTIDLGSVPVKLSTVKMFMVPTQEYKEDHPKKFEIWGTASINESAPKEYWETTIPGAWQNDWIKLADCEALNPSGQNTPTAEDIAYAQLGFSYSLNSSTPVRYIRVVIKETWGTNVATRIGDLLFSGEYLVKQ